MVESGYMLEYLSILVVPVADHDQKRSDPWENGENPQVQAISREAVVGPSETTRLTPENGWFCKKPIKGPQTPRVMI